MKRRELIIHVLGLYISAFLIGAGLGIKIPKDLGAFWFFDSLLIILGVVIIILISFSRYGKGYKELLNTLR